MLHSLLFMCIVHYTTLARCESQVFFTYSFFFTNRIPFALELFRTIITGGTECPENKTVNIAAAYAILMYGRNCSLSAWHRLITFITIKGKLNDAVSMK